MNELKIRKKVAILYAYNENWIGSTYYIQNLISALNLLDEKDKPAILVVSRDKSSFQQVCALTGYSYLNFKKLSFFERVINKLLPRFLIPRVFSKLLWGRYYSDIEVIFPATLGVSFSGCQNRLFWVADFQEHFLPSFFSVKEIAKRKSIQREIVKYGKYIVLSSRAAQSDFNRIYPSNRLRQFVLPFAVTHPRLSSGEGAIICEKYSIPKRYFICSNQFWKHKNHGLVLKALGELKKKGKEFFIVFTGKVHDYRNPYYFDELSRLVNELDLENQVRFLGFISRADQLLLMKNSIAVIQPSLFEGWSTVVEDAKALNIRIVVSDIAVHQEQLKAYEGRIFFNPQDDADLAKAIEKADGENIPLHYDYQSDILQYANAFNSILREITEYKK